MKLPHLWLEVEGHLQDPFTSLVPIIEVVPTPKSDPCPHQLREAETELLNLARGIGIMILGKVEGVVPPERRSHSRGARAIQFLRSLPNKENAWAIEGVASFS